MNDEQVKTKEPKVWIGTEKEFKEATAPAKNPIRDWDQVAAQLIRKELAPKGFSEIKHGPYRGKVKSNIEFLPKEVVGRCQNISAQLVRVFRDRSKETLDNQIKKTQELLLSTKWYQIRKQWIYQGILEALEGSKKLMDNVEVK